MGIDMTFVFQSRQATGWEDIFCELNGYYGGRDPALKAWLGLGGGDRGGSFDIEPLADPRDLPDDFAGGDVHPITELNILPEKNRSLIRNMQIYMGEFGFSYFHVDEVLNGAPPIGRRWLVLSLDEYQRWDKCGIPDDAEPISWNWKADPRYAEKILSSPEEINEKTCCVVLEVSDDFSDELAWFTDILKELRKQHGEVRFVFGYC